MNWKPGFNLSHLLNEVAVMNSIDHNNVVKCYGCKNDQASGDFIEPVNDGEACPARLTVTQPFVDTFASKRRRGVRAQAGRFVNDQDIVVFVHHARWSLYQNSHAPL